MYENGEKVNRYAAQKRHKNELKRRHTPIEYSSYEDYCDAHRRMNEQRDMWLRGQWTPEMWERHCAECQKRRDSGEKEYYEQWWKAYSHFFGPGTKKNFRTAANRKERRYYKQYLDNALRYNYQDEDDDWDFPMCRCKHFDDPWNWD